MRAFLSFCVVLLISCGPAAPAGTGRKTTADDYLKAKATGCPNVKVSAAVPSTCESSGATACSAADREALDRQLICLSRVTDCKAGAETVFYQEIVSCEPNASTLSTACRAACGLTLNGADPCALPSKCPADPAPSAQQLAACQSTIAPSAKCSVQYLALLSCSRRVQTCDAAGKTNALVVASQCATELNAYSACAI